MSKPQYENESEPVTELIGEPQTGIKLKVKRARLTVIKGPDQGLEKWIPSEGLTAGKSTSCNFVLTDRAVSGEHFRIVPTKKGFHLEDLDSRNGTWFHSTRLGDVYLDNKESIEVGRTVLVFEMTGGHQEYSLSHKTRFGTMLGQSVPMRQTFALLERAATSEATLLIEGESGTGKDIAAENVHNLSVRKDAPFITVDCGAIKAEIVESQLFGHRAGAFTDAVSDKIGAFESADGGTVFLDEIGDLSPSLQMNLLRVLEKKKVRRLGENEFRTVDVRFIAATNRNLESEVVAGRFRKDLFFRLSVLRVQLSPLRYRPEDIAPLAAAFIRKLAPNVDPNDILSENVCGMLINHTWPGNIRELRNVIERLLVFPEWPNKAIDPTGNHVSSPDIPVNFDLPFSEARDLATQHFEREYLVRLLKECEGIVVKAVQKGSIPRQTFYRLLRKHGLDPKNMKK